MSGQRFNELLDDEDNGVHVGMIDLMLTIVAVLMLLLAVQTMAPQVDPMAPPSTGDEGEPMQPVVTLMLRAGNRIEITDLASRENRTLDASDIQAALSGYADTPGPIGICVEDDVLYETYERVWYEAYVALGQRDPISTCP
jgi:biopolymer transport protein ExbD